MKTALAFFGLVLLTVIIVEGDGMALLIGNDTGLIDHDGREKRAIPLIQIVVSAVIGASIGYGFSKLTPPSEKTCNIAIASHRARGKLRMNFVTIGDSENCNDEILGGRDTTSERVDGGRLEHIAVLMAGEACLEYLAFSCGGDVTGRGTKSIVLSHESFPSYHCMMHKLWKDDACVWLSNRDENIRKFYINNDIFDCGERDYACHRRHIGSQIGGCVDMTNCKFCNRRCKLHT